MKRMTLFIHFIDFFLDFFAFLCYTINKRRCFHEEEDENMTLVLVSIFRKLFFSADLLLSSFWYILKVKGEATWTTVEAVECRLTNAGATR